MRRHFIFSLLLLVACLVCRSQGEADNWYIVGSTAMRFPGPVPMANSGMKTFNWYGEACATISDADGNLLFYADERGLYNKNHKRTPNGKDLILHASATQGCIFIPKPGDPNTYYLFHMGHTASLKNSLYYSEIDVNLDKGLGDVTVNKNVPIMASYENCAEKMAATKHCNGIDYWVLVHDELGNAYQAYLVTGAGINTTPIVSLTGSVFEEDFSLGADRIGQMKISPDGSKVSAVLDKKHQLELSNFDKATGVVSNTIILGNVWLDEDCYGTEFSSDSKKVYGSTIGYLGDDSYIKQWDLSAGSNAAIIASGMIIGQTEYTRAQALQLAPDGKIYFKKYLNVPLGVIESPNLQGMACAYNDNGPMLTPSGPTGFGFGLPSFASNYLGSSEKCESFFISKHPTSSCQQEGRITVEINLNSCSPDNYIYTWSNGFVEGPTTKLTSTISNLLPGSYNVIISRPNTCVPDDTIDVFLKDYPDTIGYWMDQVVSICDGDVYTLPGGKVVSSSGVYFTQLNTWPCDTILVTKLSVKSVLLGTTDVTICSGDEFMLPDGSVVNTAGIYSDTVKASGGCDSVVTVNLTVSDPIYTVFDMAICAGEHFTMPDGSAASTSGSYHFMLTSVNGCDSNITVNLAVGDPINTTLHPTICFGESFVLPDGSVQSNTGTYSYVLTSSGGCDSVVTVHLTVSEPIHSVFDVDICAGESFTMPDGSMESASGTYHFTLATVDGCDSNITIHLNVLTASTSALHPKICHGQEYILPDGSVVDATGVYTTNMINSSGCDSVIVTNLNVSDVLFTTLNPIICSGDGYTLPDGSVETNSGTYSHVLTALGGCDSIVTTNLTVNPLLFQTLILELCEGEHYSLSDGTVINAPGSYTYISPNSGGCDSIITAEVSINPLPGISSSGDVTIEKGESTTLHVNGKGTVLWSPSYALGCDSCISTISTPEESTEYTVTLTDSNGCSSSKTLLVNVVSDIHKDNPAFFIPNAFTPNGDIVNSSFRPVGSLITDNNYLFSIYDRWGLPLFQSLQPSLGWDGFFEGQEVPLDVYAWTLKFIDSHGALHQASGKVTVLR